MSGVPEPAPQRPHLLRRVVSRLDPFLLGLLGVVALASVLPARGDVARGLDTVVWVAVAFLFLLYGVRLPTREAVAALRGWRLHSAVLTVTYVVFPLLGLAAYVATRTVLPHDLALGLLFLTLLPSTVQSSIAFTSMARGNVAGAVVTASLSNLVGVLLTPLLAALLLGGAVVLTGGSVARIASQLLLPFVVGQLARPLLGRWVAAHPALTRVADRGAVLLVVYAAFSEAVTGGIWSQVSVPDLVVTALAALAVLGAALGLTTFAGRRLGLDRADRVVVLMCGSVKSLASGIPLATVLLPTAALGVMMLPLMIFHQAQLIVGATIARRLGERADPVAA